MSLAEAIKYIRHVLNDWTEWGTHHQVLVKALAVILNHIDNGGDTP